MVAITNKSPPDETFPAKSTEDFMGQACDLLALATAPEWVHQYMAIQSGKKTFDDFSFEERTCRGWLTPYLWQIDGMFHGRWAYWVTTLHNGKLLDDPIPKIGFLGEANPGLQNARKNIHACLDAYCCYTCSARLTDLFDWILWGFGEGEERPRINEQVNEHWYRTFNLGYLIQSPHDYMGDFLADAKQGYWNNPNAFYPTPHNMVECMVKMQFECGADNTIDFRSKSVLDPCVGTGRMLMYASNYSLNLYGVDIDRTCVTACKINGYLYMPWLVRPGHGLVEGIISPGQGSGVERGNSLHDLRTAPVVEKVEKIVKIEEVKEKKRKPEQMKLF